MYMLFLPHQLSFVCWFDLVVQIYLISLLVHVGPHLKVGVRTQISLTQVSFKLGYAASFSDGKQIVYTCTMVQWRK